jgi:hypothetical protein
MPEVNEILTLMRIFISDGVYRDAMHYPSFDVYTTRMRYLLSLIANNYYWQEYTTLIFTHITPDEFTTLSVLRNNIIKYCPVFQLLRGVRYSTHLFAISDTFNDIKCRYACCGDRRIFTVHHSITITPKEYDTALTTLHTISSAQTTSFLHPLYQSYLGKFFNPCYYKALLRMTSSRINNSKIRTLKKILIDKNCRLIHKKLSRGITLWTCCATV